MGPWVTIICQGVVNLRYYLFDGSFEGLLTAVYEGFYSPDKPDGIRCEATYEPMLMDEFVELPTDGEKARKVADAISSKLSAEVFKHVLYAYFSEEPDVGDVVYQFLKLAFKKGPSIIDHESEPTINRLLRMSRSVSFEAHRMLGLVRFMELESGIFYSKLEPTRNILAVLAQHFSERLGSQTWVIHDLKRERAAFYDQQNWFIRDLPASDAVKLHERELDIQAMWQEYFKRIAIKERINPKLQQGMMPKKYWKYLVEKQ